MNILHSYPRSGNSFFRYCIEFITNLKTVDGQNGNPLIIKNKNIDGFKYKSDVPILYKRHFYNHEFTNNKVIVLLRNPFELIISNILRTNRKSSEDFFLTQFNAFCKKIIDNKSDDFLFIKYEDLLNGESLKDILVKTLNFLNINIDMIKINDLIQNYDIHRQNSIFIYSNIQCNKIKSDSQTFDYFQKNNVKHLKIIKQKIKDKQFINKLCSQFYNY